MARVNTAVVAAAAVVLLGACSSGGGAAPQISTPATATTSTAAPVQTVTSALVTSTAVPPPTSTSHVVPSTSISATTSTAPTIPGAATTTTAAEPVGGDEYVSATPPVAPPHTHVVPADNTHPDGVYYGTVSEGGDPPAADGSVVFELVQLFTGADCTAHFGAEDEDACLNDYGVETDPTSSIEVALGEQYITVVDSATQLSYQVTGHELYRLIQGEQPAEGAPEGYFYSGFGFFVTFKDGKVIRLEQWWTP